jgi:hypothetical protein
MMRWTGDVSLINEGRNAYKVLVRIHHLVEQSIDRRIILNIVGVNTFLGNNNEISNYTTAVAK